MKLIKIIIIILLILLLLFLFNMKITKEICFKDKCFTTEVAKTVEARKQGLMYRQSLEQDKAMLFIFPNEGIYSFHMRNVNFPLDIVWLNKDKEIVFIKRNALPGEENIIPDKPGQYVIELNPGLVNLEIGDKVDF